MSKPVVVAPKRALRAVEEPAPEIVEAGPTRASFGFSWSFTEISLSGGQTRVRSQQTRFADGKLQTESFEGELPGSDTYAQALQRAQQRWLDQISALMRLVDWLLPPPKR